MAALAVWALSALPAFVDAQASKDKEAKDSAPGGKKDDAPKTKDAKGDAKAKEPVKLGLHVNDPKAFQGYTLFAPMRSGETYLIDMQGHVVRTWKSDCHPALSAMLLDNGHLLRPGELPDTKSFGGGPGTGGRLQEFTWDGELVWDFKFYNDKQLPHHAITRLPNGNVILIVHDKKTAKETLDAGRRPEAVGTHLVPDSLVEIKPTGKTTGEVVWEWHVWDHLVQEHDKDKANYGKVAEHPELVDINFGQDVVGAAIAKKDGLKKLQGIGYVGANTGKGKGPNSDWTHFNGVAYNADLDQLAISVHAFSEFWVIDHSTTKAQAAGHTGGKSGKGGDLLYRWGNPRAYHAGTKNDQRLFAQHNATWIPKGTPGEGHMLVFNNGMGRPDGNYSTVDEIVPPVDAKGSYFLKTGSAYGPDKAAWSYNAPKKSDFFSSFISGTQRLPNGNTLICSGANGTVFEVTPDKQIVWKYINPVKESFGKGPDGKGKDFKGKDGKFDGKDGKGPDGKGPDGKGFGKGPDGKGPGGKGFGGPFGPGGMPQAGEILPNFLQDMLKLSADQKKKLGELQKDVTGKLDKILTEEQNKQLKDAKPGFPPGGFGGPPPVGQILPSFLQDSLKLADDQKKQVADLQKDTDSRLDKLLNDQQKTQLKDMRTGRFAGGPGGFGGGPPGGASLFRAERYAVNHLAFVGRDLTPGPTVEELQAKEQKTKENKK
jgi:hypothetical protein